MPGGGGGTGVPASSAPAGRDRTWLFAVATGVIVLNLFSAQPLVAPVSAALGMGPWTQSLVATAPLLGYALGLFLFVPLSDVAENRLLVLLAHSGDCSHRFRVHPLFWC